MSELPQPLTPVDCDLTDFPFIPLQIMRLRRSKAWLAAKRNPSLAFYMINLWTASWHEIPAASLEDDDDMLAEFAMCDPVKWDKLRVAILRGWVKCSDGRLYHPTVAEKAIEAWNSKLDQRWRTECARIKKHNDRHKTNLPRPTFDEWVESGCPSGQRLPVPRDNSGTEDGQGRETRSKREGEGQRQGDSIIPVPNGTGGAGAPLDSNDAIWQVAIPWMIERGCQESKIRSLLGGAVKAMGADAAWVLAQSCMEAKALNPVEYIAAGINKHLKENGDRRGGADRRGMNRQEQLEADNRAVVRRMMEKEAHDAQE